MDRGPKQGQRTKLLKSIMNRYTEPGFTGRNYRSPEIVPGTITKDSEPRYNKKEQRSLDRVQELKKEILNQGRDKFYRDPELGLRNCMDRTRVHETLETYPKPEFRSNVEGRDVQ
jgi:hypothetical protein